VNIVKGQTINFLGLKYPRAKKQLDVWYNEAKRGKWNSPSDIKQEYPKASILKDKRVTFDINGGEYSLIIKVEYEFQGIFILFFGTHQEYDLIDANTISNY